MTRVLDVPSSTTLPELHDLLQAALGWTDSHLHQFIAGDQRWGVPHADSWDELELDERTAALKDLPSTFVYLYDFGDSWEHDVEVLEPGEAPGLVEGSGACPPEDCGGAPGYEHLLHVLADPRHEEYAHTKRWSSQHSFVFDEAATAVLVGQVLGSVPATVRAMLEVVGAGLKLTQAGKLPPATVAALLQRCPGWEPLGAIREDNVLEACVLKDMMREVGLLRLSRGVLSATKAASDDREIVRRLRRLFPEGAFETLLFTGALAVLTTEGPLEREVLMARTLPMMGRGWTMNGEPLDERSLRSAWSRVWPLGCALDLLEGGWSRRIEQAGPSALTLLPRAAQLPRLRSTEG